MKAHPVGEKLPNRFGLYDVLGNVLEWVNDRYDYKYYLDSPSRDPMGPTRGMERVYRGGSWNIFSSNVRVSARGEILPTTSHNNFGFRCARYVFAP